MQIWYLAPLSAAYARMKAALFRPFSLSKWIYLGFASWIAGWGAGESWGWGFQNRFAGGNFAESWGDFSDAWLELWADPWWKATVLLAAFLLVVLVVVILWVRSRGAFVFLESVARDRMAIVEPWTTFSKEGNSLFLWQLALTLIGLAYASALGIAVWRLVFGGRIPYSVTDVAWPVLVAIVVFLWLPVALLFTLVLHFLHHFVAPIMYRDRVRTNDAWRRLFGLFRTRPDAFLVYPIFVLALRILTGLGILMVTCATCCIAGCFLAIPFVGTVLYLPFSYTFRALGLEFLAQFPSEPAILSPLVVPPPIERPLTTP